MYMTRHVQFHRWIEGPLLYGRESARNLRPGSRSCRDGAQSSAADQAVPSVWDPTPLAKDNLGGWKKE